jgi:hypothetical protein
MANNFSNTCPFFETGTISTSYTSNPFRVGDFDRFAIQFAISGTLAGGLKLQASIDDLNYVDIPDSIISINGTDVFLISIAYFAYKYARVVYTRTSGTGAIEAKINLISFQR